MSLHLAASNDPIEPPSAEAILDALPFAVYTTDPEGRITAFNQAAVEMWGRAPELGEQWCGSHKLFWPDGRPMAHHQCPMAETLQTGVAVRGAEAILERPDGTRVHFSPFPTALKDAEGRITSGINILVDITQRIHADRAKSRLAAVVESSDDAIISKDLDGTIRSWNKSAERIFGYTAEETVGRHVSLLIPPDRLNEEPDIINRIRRGERVDHYETVRQRKDGSLIDISLTISPVKDAYGRIVGASKIARDITDQRRAERAKELLLHEIKHRVKNTLGTVQAIAAQTFRDGPRQERDAFGGRLRALSSAHDLLTQHEWSQVSVKDMINRALAPFQEDRAERFEISGDDMILDSNPAVLLAMAIHELATNAVKYGALSNASGRVALTWRVTQSGEGRGLALEWRERGGPAVAIPTRKGFGSALIERALVQDQGRSCLEFHPEGVVCALEMKI